MAFYSKSNAAPGPILDRLYNADVVAIFHEEDGTFSVEEGCDNYFRLALTADELRALGEEIIRAADQPPKA